jgi:hypothetical protein
MSKEPVLYHIGRFNHVGSRQIANWLNQRLDVDYDWGVYYAEETDLFDYTNMIFMRGDQLYRLAYFLIADLELFLDIDVGFIWSWEMGKEFTADVCGVPELGVRYYVGPELLPDGESFPGLPPVEINYNK